MAQAVTPKEIAKSKLRSLPAQNKTFVCADVHVDGPAISCKHAEVAWPGGGDGNGDAARRRRRCEKTSGSVGRGERGMGCGGGGDARPSLAGIPGVAGEPLAHFAAGGRGAV